MAFRDHWSDWVADPSAPARYCICGHPEQHHRPECRTNCDCDTFSAKDKP